jgi:peptidoglycan/LPS O-acetylase OafA/YrhL
MEQVPNGSAITTEAIRRAMQNGQGSQSAHERFEILDGLRGVAALVVLVFHVVQQQSFTALPYAGLAVDFFYVLSGFVVAFAYERRLQQGEMTIGQFFRVRANRLYPLLFLGTASGIILGILAVFTKRNISMTQVLEAGALGLLILPSFVFPQWGTAYPFNMASWSLTFEAFANTIYGFIAKGLSNVSLIILTLLSAAGLIWLVLKHHGVGGGNNQDGWALGFIRVMFPFFVGVLLFRYRLPARRTNLASFAILIGLFAMLIAAWPSYAVTSAIYVLILFPGLVFIGAAVTASAQISAFCAIIGALSYPVYILQGPVLRLGEEALKHLHLSGLRLATFDAAEIFSVLVVAWLGLKFFDEPIQRRLKKRRFAASGSLPLSLRS